MRAYLIDPHAQTVTEVEYQLSDSVRGIYSLIGADCIDAVRLAKGDCIFVDDNGLFVEDQKFFGINGYDQPLAGKGLVLGSDAEGESTDPVISLDALRALVKFPDVEFTGMTPIEPHMEGDFMVLGSTANFREKGKEPVSDVRHMLRALVAVQCMAEMLELDIEKTKLGIQKEDIVSGKKTEVELISLAEIIRGLTIRVRELKE